MVDYGYLIPSVLEPGDGWYPRSPLVVQYWFFSSFYFMWFFFQMICTYPCLGMQYHSSLFYTMILIVMPLCSYIHLVDYHRLCRAYIFFFISQGWNSGQQSWRRWFIICYRCRNVFPISSWEVWTFILLTCFFKH